MTDHVDAVAFLPRGARPSRKLVGVHDFVTPSLPTPAIARPSVWEASQQSVEEVLASLAAAEKLVAGQRLKSLGHRLRKVESLLGWLQRFEGESWQQRWLVSGADTAGKTWPELVADLWPAGITDAAQRSYATGAVNRLVLVDVIRPGYSWLYAAPTYNVFDRFAKVRDGEGFARIVARCDADPRLTPYDRNRAIGQLAKMLMHNGGTLADITLADCVEAYRAQNGYTAIQHSHWYALLLAEGILPADSPPHVRAASRRGQLTVEELVDGYNVECRPVRNLFVDYLHHRSPGLDYNTIRRLAGKLVLLFWRDLELHHPGIDSLHLTDDMARGWKERLRHIRYGNHRLGEERGDPYDILMSVRAFYADLSHWALEDPGRWAAWAAPSPVDSRDLTGMTKWAKHRQSRMHQRTRELAPLLPQLVAAAHTRRHSAAAQLAAATATPFGESFVHEGVELRRYERVNEPERRGLGRPGVVWVTSPDGTGPRRNLTVEADRAFWAWACVEVFRHTGIRIEEMLEITHRSFVSYTLPATGEIIPLLQITPSKSDKERLLVIGPELAAVFAEIIGHVRNGNPQLPLVSRYDQHERLHSPALPFLFQRRWGLRDVTINHGLVKDLLDDLVTAAGITNTDGSPAHFSPHDFRRIFATEAVSQGLPVHIAAKILGHESLATTQTYVAVYDQDVIEHHRAFIARRRSSRPSQEYREPTDSEWDEFLGHWAARKLELGTCGRAYGTSCQHEHACIRCPMLRPDPTQQPRLEHIIASLEERITEATDHGWLGDVTGLTTSLEAARRKLTQMRRTATNLGLPTRASTTQKGANR